jgi:hypothetical protein
MIRLEDLQPTAASWRTLPERVVTTVHHATVVDRTKILCAASSLRVDAQDIGKDFFLQASAPFLDARLLSPDLQESEQ